MDLSNAGLIRARVTRRGCEDCILELARQSGGKYPIEGTTVEIPRDWLNLECSHGRLAPQFQELLEEIEPTGPQRAKDGDVELEPIDPRIDATRNVGYPIREHGLYGSHPMHDDFDDDSDPDGSGTY